MSVENVISELKNLGSGIEVFTLDESGATVEEAARTLGVSPDAIAKTLSLHLNDSVIIVVMSGEARIDNKKYRSTFQAKAKMLSFEEVEPLTGHPVGGMSPFGLKRRLPVFLDESLRKHEYVYPAAGDRFHSFKISVKELKEYTGAQWVDVCSQPQSGAA